MSDEEALEALEIDLEIADIGEVLERHGVTPSSDLVVELWLWKESQVKAATGGER